MNVQERQITGLFLVWHCSLPFLMGRPTYSVGLGWHQFSFLLSNVQEINYSYNNHKYCDRLFCWGCIMALYCHSLVFSHEFTDGSLQPISPHKAQLEVSQ